MKEVLNQIYSFIDNNREEMISLWEEIVRLESYSREPHKVNIIGKRLKEVFENEGLSCKLVDVGNNGNTLIGLLGHDRPGKPIVFSGHMDTVFSTGTFGENLFNVVNGQVHGPGVLDMKGGIIISLYVIKALNHIGYKERPIKIIYLGDEEIGHIGSSAAELIINESVGGLCAFNMETGLMDNSLCIGRKGRIECHVTIDGVETHAGADFVSGRNAIEEMAYKIIDFQNLTNLEAGTTVSVGKIKGGTVSNAIPAHCKIEIDIRFENLDEMNKIKEQIQHVCEKTYIEGTSTLCEFVNIMAAFETTDFGIEFYNFVNEISKEYGFGEMGSKRLGGSSDASYITMAKTPVICSFGVKGHWNHTIKEFAVVESLFDRAKLIATIILNLNKFK